MYFGDKSKDKLKIVRNFYLWIFVLIVTAVTAVAGAGQEPAKAAVRGRISTGEVAEGIQEDTIIPLFNCEEDFGIRKALAMLGSMCQRNIVPSPSVDGSLAFRRLTNVTFEEAMDAILGDNFKYEQQGNLIKVYTKEEYKKLKEDPERLEYKIFTLYYISAAEAKKMITPVLSANGRLETTSAAATDFPTGESISSGNGGGDATAMNDTIIIYDYPENIEAVAQVLSEVDVRPKQVLIEATILSATLTEDTQFGIDWQNMFGVVGSGVGATALARGTFPTTTSPGRMDFTNSLNTNQVTKSGGLSIGIHDNLTAFIRAVEEVSDVTILANPKILAVNKQLGQVYIGKKLGYQSQTTQTDTSTTEQVEFLDTGTKLSFRPYIGNDGYIRMDIHPKDSSGDLKSNSIPDETSAELLTNIIVKDGETIVIGGLFRDTIRANKTQVPILGDLPFVGGLFRGTADQVKREEVIITLTPHIIVEPNETGGDDRADDIRRKRFGAKDELQWIGRSRLAEDHYAKAVMYYEENQTIAAKEEIDAALRLRPGYLEAIRLKERIITEFDGKEALERLERKMLEDIDNENAPGWIRR
jgi:type IV pilus assembly protein PilQ